MRRVKATAEIQVTSYKPQTASAQRHAQLVGIIRLIYIEKQKEKPKEKERKIEKKKKEIGKTKCKNCVLSGPQLRRRKTLAAIFFFSDRDPPVRQCFSLLLTFVQGATP